MINGLNRGMDLPIDIWWLKILFIIIASGLQITINFESMNSIIKKGKKSMEQSSSEIPDILETIMKLSNIYLRIKKLHLF